MSDKFVMMTDAELNSISAYVNSSLQLGDALSETDRSNLHTLERLIKEVLHYQRAIRKHRDYRGDDRCFLDDKELYESLPEGDTRPARDSAVSLDNCKRFIACRQYQLQYISPQLYIDEIERKLYQHEEREKQYQRKIETLEFIVATYEKWENDQACRGTPATREQDRQVSSNESSTDGVLIEGRPCIPLRE